MVSSEVDKSGLKSWLASPGFAGAVVLAGVVASLISARLTPVALFAIVLAVLGPMLSDRRWPQWEGGKDRIVVCFSALLGWAFLSPFWSEVFGPAFSKLVLAALVAFGALAAVRYFATCGRDLATEAAKGLLIGLIAGSAFLTVEVYTDQAIQRAVYNFLQLPRDLMQPERHFKWDGDFLRAMTPAHINRNFAVASLLLFPAIAAALGLYGRRRGAIVAGLCSVLVVVSVFGSRHESSKVALLAGAVLLLMGLFSARWARRVLAAGWVVICIAIVPIVLAAHRLDLHNAPWLQNSMQHRIVIWNYTAAQALKSPVLGMGAYMTYVQGPKLSEGAVPSANEHQRPTLSRHAHNVFLQTWVELGAVGAVLLAACGFVIVMAIGRMNERAQPFALATFATAMAMMAASYGIWQAWYLALFGLAAVALAIGLKSYTFAIEEKSKPSVRASL